MPEFHVIAAAKEAGIPYDDEHWQKLEWERQSDLVAHYFLAKMIRDHGESALSDDIKRKSSKRPAKGKRR